MTTKEIKCLSCGRDDFDTWEELALHISQAKTGHQRSKRFAAKVLMSVNERPETKRAVRNPDYQPTAFGDENRERAVRQLSGDTVYANTHCPTCNKSSRQLLPVEFVTDRAAWRNSVGAIMTNCQGCRRD